MKVGIQLYSVRNRMAKDPVAAIKAVVGELNNFQIKIKVLEK
jgi:hypothetical protein